MTDSKRIIEPIIARYYKSFVGKNYSDENNDHDVLMDIFGISPELKRENRQYWGRELGMAWQHIVTELCKKYCCSDFKPALRFGVDEPCDLILGKDAIDTKYRIGSGDSGTLKKFKQYGQLLIKNGYKPVFLILREDNLPAAITACYSGGWTVHIGDAAFNYLLKKTKVDVKALLTSFGDKYIVNK